jgi:salicylate hydroxylase
LLYNFQNMPSTTQEQPFRIAIAGGGIGGLFTAIAIHHHCTSTPNARPVKIDVYEQASQYKEIGAGVGLGINAARLVHKLGFGDKLNEIAGHRTGVWISFRKYRDSGEVVTVPVNDDQTVRQAPCARSDLLDLLKDTVESRNAATLHTKKAFTSVEDLGSSVRITFADSTTIETDLLVGCDGIHSSVRRCFAVDRPIFSGTIAYRGLVPISEIKEWPFPSYSVLWVAKHRHFLVFPIRRNQLLNIVAFVTKGKDSPEVKDVKESWTSVCDDKTEVERDYEGFDTYVQDLIKLMPDQPSKWSINDREPLDQWHYLGGKVILLGDSAHAMLPHLGAGAGQSLEDGWVLGRALAEYLSATSNPHFESLETTAALYQSVRLPRAQKTQATSRAAGDTYEMQAPDMLEKSFEECCEMIAERTRERMKWVWEEDLDAAYEKVRDGGLPKEQEEATNGEKAQTMTNGTAVQAP